MTFRNFNTIDYFLQGNIIKIHIEKYLNLYNFLIRITNYIYISKYLEVIECFFLQLKNLSLQD